MVQREVREEGAERAIEAAEREVFGLGMEVSPQLADSLRNAEDAVRGAMRVAGEIDALFGVTGEQARARLGDEIRRMDESLGAIGAMRVGGVEERYLDYVEGLRGIAAEAGAALERGEDGEAARLFGQAREGVGALSEVISTARRLAAAGAPAELVNGADAALEFFSSGEAERGRLLLTLGESYLRNAELLSGNAGAGHLAGLEGLSRTASDPSLSPDIEIIGMEARLFMDGLERFASDFYSIGGLASELRGRGGRAAERARDEGTPEWFGAQARELLEAGDVGSAAIAVSLGMVERDALEAGARRGAREFLDEGAYTEIIDGINAGGMGAERLGALASEVKAAGIALDVAGINSRFEGLGAEGGEARRVGLVLRAASAATLELEQGNVERAGQLVYMANRYMEALDSASRGWQRGTEASLEMETALEGAMLGGDTLPEFVREMAVQEFWQESSRMLVKLSWGSGMAEESRLALTALNAVDRLAEEGDFERAGALLTLTAMYIDSVGKVGARGADGRLESLDGRFEGSGMEQAMLALAGAGEVDVGAAERQFMESYNGAQRLAVDMQVEQLEALTPGRGIGRDTVRVALGVAQERAADGNFAGAHLILGYVRGFYGAAEEGKEAGWRYGMFSGENAGIEGYAAGTQGMLDAVRKEIAITRGRREDTEELHREIAEDFWGNAERIENTAMLVEAQAQYREGFFAHYPDPSRVEWVEAVEPQVVRVGEAPVGPPVAVPVVAEVRTVRRELSLEDVRAYDAEFHERDEVLRRSPTLEQMLADCDSAAARGDVDGYNDAKGRLEEQIDVVANRIVRAQNLRIAIAELRDVVGTLEMMEGEMNLAINASGAPEGDRVLMRSSVHGRIYSLERMGESLGSRLEAAIFTADDFLDVGASALQDYADFLERFRDEAKLETGMLAGFQFLTSQIEQVDAYYTMLAPGVAPPGAREYLSQSRAQLESARRVLLGATDAEGLERAESGYRMAVDYRTLALIGYREGGGEGRVSQERSERGIIGRDWGEYSAYAQLNEGAFHTIISDPEAASRGGWRGRAAGLVERAVFGVPRSQIGDSENRADQAEVLAIMGDVLKDTGYIGQGLSRAGAVIDRLEERVEDQVWWDHAKTIGAGVAAGFIPVVGPSISAITFTWMAVDGIANEYAMTGEVSARSWVNLGLIVGTGGLGAVSQMLRTAEMAAVGTGAAARANTLGRVATGIDMANLGVGGYFMVDMSIHAAESFAAGDYRNGILNLGMAMFPAVHLGTAGGRYLEVRSARRAAMGTREEMRMPVSDRIGQVLEVAEARAAAAPAETAPVAGPRARAGPEEALASFETEIARAHAQREGRVELNAADLEYASAARQRAQEGLENFRGLEVVEMEPISPARGEEPFFTARVRSRGGAEYVVRVDARGARVEWASASSFTADAASSANENRAAARYAEVALAEELGAMFRAPMEQMARGNFGTAVRIAREGPVEQMSAAEIDAALARYSSGQSTVEERARTLDSFAMLSGEEQGALLMGLRSAGRHQETAMLIEFSSLNGEVGHALEAAYSAQIRARTGMVPQGSLSELYIMQGSPSNARGAFFEALGIRLGPYPSANKTGEAYRNFRSLADDGFLFGMITSGDMIGAVGEMYGGSTVTSIAFKNGMVGAYEVRVVDGAGYEHTVYLKRINLGPDRAGAEYSVASGIPAPEFFTARPAERARAAEAYGRYARGEALSAEELAVAREVEAAGTRMGPRMGDRARVADVYGRYLKGEALSAEEGAVAREVEMAIDVVADSRAALQYAEPGGAISQYGISVNLAEFDAYMMVAGRQMRVRTVDQIDVNRMLESPELGELFLSERNRFWEELGFALCGSYSAGIRDRHESNIRMMRLEVVKPSAEDVAALGYELVTDAAGRQSLRPIASNPARVAEIDAQGRLVVTMIGNIDVDSGGTYHIVADSQGRFGTIRMREITAEEELHRLFVRLTLRYNEHEAAQAAAEGREPQFVMVNDLLLEAFGTEERPGFFMDGVMRWMGEFSTNPEYVEGMVRMMESREGSAGMGLSLNADLLARVEQNGIFELHRPNNGEPITPIEFRDGRIRARAEYEVADVRGIAEELRESVMGRFPHNREVYILPAEPGQYTHMEAYGDHSFAIFWSAAEIPPGMEGSVIPVARHFDYIRAGPGFSEATGIQANVCGSVPVFRFLMERSVSSTERDWTGIGEDIARVERGRRAVAEDALMNGDDSLMQKYISSRLPPGYGAEHITGRRTQLPTPPTEEIPTGRL